MINCILLNVFPLNLYTFPIVLQAADDTTTPSYNPFLVDDPVPSLLLDQNSPISASKPVSDLLNFFKTYTKSYNWNNKITSPTICERDSDSDLKSPLQFTRVKTESFLECFDDYKPARPPRPPPPKNDNSNFSKVKSIDKNDCMELSSLCVDQECVKIVPLEMTKTTLKHLEGDLL